MSWNCTVSILEAWNVYFRIYTLLQFIILWGFPLSDYRWSWHSASSSSIRWSTSEILQRKDLDHELWICDKGWYTNINFWFIVINCHVGDIFLWGRRYSYPWRYCGSGKPSKGPRRVGGRHGPGEWHAHTHTHTHTHTSCETYLVVLQSDPRLLFPGPNCWGKCGL